MLRRRRIRRQAGPVTISARRICRARLVARHGVRFRWPRVRAGGANPCGADHSRQRHRRSGARPRGSARQHGGHRPVAGPPNAGTRAPHGAHRVVSGKVRFSRSKPTGPAARWPCAAPSAYPPSTSVLSASLSKTPRITSAVELDECVRRAASRLKRGLVCGQATVATNHRTR